jgi:hypothetical protein
MKSALVSDGIERANLIGSSQGVLPTNKEVVWGDRGEQNTDRSNPVVMTSLKNIMKKLVIHLLTN